MEVKLILVGEVAVGKTCLAHCYLGNPFEVHPSNVDPTSLLKKVVQLSDGTEVRLTIWDTAGQEKFRSMLDMYFRQADAALICCDKDNVNSVEEFVNLVREKEPTAAIFVALTKSDLYDEETKQQLLSDLNKKAGELNVKHVIATSAKTNDGVDGLFQAAAQEAYEVAKGKQGKEDVKPADDGAKRSCC